MKKGEGARDSRPHGYASCSSWCERWPRLAAGRSPTGLQKAGDSRFAGRGQVRDIWRCTRTNDERQQSRRSVRSATEDGWRAIRRDILRQGRDPVVS